VRPAREGHALTLVVPGALTGDLHEIARRVRAMFDLDADMTAIRTHLARDPLLASAVRRRPGLRVPGAWDPFELAVRAILGQVVSVRAATTLAGRLAATHGHPLTAPSAGSQADGGWRLFPGPGDLCDAALEVLGIPHPRADAVRALAAGISKGQIDLASFPDREIAVQALRELPGIGAWTAEYIAMRALREPDAFPAGDLGLRAAAAAGSRRLSEAALRRRAEAWRPWRAYAAMHLWTIWAGRVRTGKEVRS